MIKINYIHTVDGEIFYNEKYNKGLAEELSVFKIKPYVDGCFEVSNSYRKIVIYPSYIKYVDYIINED